MAEANILNALSWIYTDARSDILKETENLIVSSKVHYTRNTLKADPFLTQLFKRAQSHQFQLNHSGAAGNLTQVVNCSHYLRNLTTYVLSGLLVNSPHKENKHQQNNAPWVVTGLRLETQTGWLEARQCRTELMRDLGVISVARRPAE